MLIPAKTTMQLFYCLNIISYLLTLLIIPIYFSRRFHLGVWNLLTIPVLVTLPLTSLTSFSGPYAFLADSLFNPYFQYALLVSNVYTVLQAVALIFLVHQIQKNRALSQRLAAFMARSGEAKPARMIVAAWIFLALFFLAFLLLTQSFGLLNWIGNPRVGYQAHRSGSGQWFALALTFLSVSLVLATVYVRSTHSILLTAPLYLLLSSLLGSKGYSINFAIFLVIILVIRRYSYLKPVVVLIGAGAAGLVISTFSASQGGFGLEQISQYSDYYVNAAMYYKGYLAGQVPLFHGEVALTRLWALVPRGLYPNKPYVYGPILVDEIFYPGGAENTNTPAFATVDYFSDFGWLQVFVSGLFAPQNFVNAFLYAAVLPNLRALNVRNSLPHPRLLTYCFLMMSAPFFLMYFEFPIYQIMLLLIVGIIHLANRVRLSSASAEGGIPALEVEPGR